MGNFKGLLASDFFMLAENRFMNSRSFYESKKDEIKEKIIIPLRALASDVNEYMLKVDAEMFANPTRQLSRVFRDSRRSSDKTLYRENLWIGFSRNKKEFELYPSFWFEVFQDGYTYGVGFFYSTPALMECYRNEILKNTAKFSRMVKGFESEGFSTYGECYKRPKEGKIPKSIYEYYNKKNIGVFKSGGNIDDLADENFSQKLIENYKKLAPMYRLLLSASLSERQRQIEEKESVINA